MWSSESFGAKISRDKGDKAMIIPSAIRQRFVNLEPELKVISSRVRETVFGYCDREGFAYAGRTKTLESLAEKIGHLSLDATAV